MGPGHLASWVAQFSYPAVFALLVACGFGAPISEELILITGGLVVAQGHGHLSAMIAVAYVGVLCSDGLLYRIGRRVGPSALQNQRLQKILGPARVEWITGHFRRHGVETIFAVRFLPGLRAPTYFLAGIGRFRTWAFAGADALAAAISAPLMVWLGYRFGATVLQGARSASRGLLLAASLGIIAALAIRWTLRRTNARTRARTQPET